MKNPAFQLHRTRGTARWPPNRVTSTQPPPQPAARSGKARRGAILRCDHSDRARTERAPYVSSWSRAVGSGTWNIAVMHAGGGINNLTGRRRCSITPWTGGRSAIYHGYWYPWHLSELGNFVECRRLNIRLAIMCSQRVIMNFRLVGDTHPLRASLPLSGSSSGLAINASCASSISHCDTVQAPNLPDHDASVVLTSLAIAFAPLLMLIETRLARDCIRNARRHASACSMQRWALGWNDPL
jgi:hypothetical protein